MHLGTAIVWIWLRSSLHVLHCLSTSGSRGSSHWAPFLHMDWRMFLPTRTTGDRKPRGSKIDAMLDSTPRLVRGCSFILAVNLNSSFWRQQCTPRARSTCRVTEFDCKSRSLMASACSEFGMAVRTLLLRNLWSLTLPLAHISTAFLTTATASYKMSTSYHLHRNHWWWTGLPSHYTRHCCHAAQLRLFGRVPPLQKSDMCSNMLRVNKCYDWSVVKTC